MIQPAGIRSIYCSSVGPMSFHPSKYTGADKEWKSLGPAQNLVDPRLRMASTFRCLALSELAQDKSRRAIMLLKKACQLQESIAGKSSSELASMLDDLAEIYFTQGAFADARPIFWRAHLIDSEKFGATDARLVRRLIKMSWISYELEDYRSAYDLYSRVQAIRSRNDQACPAFNPRSPLGQAQRVSQLEYRFIEQILAGLAESVEPEKDSQPASHRMRCGIGVVVDCFKWLLSSVKSKLQSREFDCSPSQVL